MDSSEFLGFLTTRASVREYGDEPVTDGEIRFMLDCASTAPSAGNLEAWDVVLVTDEDTRLELREAAYGQEQIGEAPLIVIVCANYIRSMSQYGERGILYAIQDATIAGTYLILAAHALSLHSCWTGAFIEDDVRTTLALPQHIRPVALLAIGKGSMPSTLTGRMAVGEHLHFGHW